jgi:hypothetical protein
MRRRDLISPLGGGGGLAAHSTGAAARVGYVDRILKGGSRPIWRCRHRPSMNW